jgi:hypothetical protein
MAQPRRNLCISPRIPGMVRAHVCKVAPRGLGEQDGQPLPAMTQPSDLVPIPDIATAISVLVDDSELSAEPNYVIGKRR